MLNQSRLTLMRRQSLAVLLAIAVGASCVPRAFAANYTWDSSGAAPLDDGSGTWTSTGGTNWFNGTTYGAWGNTTSDVAFFGVGSGAAGTVTVSGSVTTNGLTFNDAGSGNYTLSGGTIGLGGTTTTITVNAAGTTTIGSLLTGTVGMVKSGAGTLSLTGLSSSTASNYSGSTVLGQGTLAITSAGTAAFSGGLVFGGTAGATNTGTLDLTNASAQFNSLNVQTNSTGTNVITIGSGKTLTVNGNFTMGVSLPAANTRMAIGGATAGVGSMVVSSTASSGQFRVGSSGNPNPSGTILDMSSLGTLSVNLSGASSAFRIGSSSAVVNIAYTSAAYLAVSSTITAKTIGVGDTATDLVQATLYLGSGAQRLNADSITLAGGNRSSGSILFSGSTGSVTVRSQSGTGRADLTMVSGAANANAANSATFNVLGHDADLLLGTVTLANLSGPGNTYTATFSFDQGTLDVTTLLSGSRTSVGGSVQPVSTINLGSSTNSSANTSTLGTIRMATHSGTANGINSVMNIAGVNTTVTATGAWTLATISATTASTGTATGAVNISGGTVNANSGILLRTGSGFGTANGTLGITGGSLVSGGDITSTGSFGGGAATLTLNGGSLNMGGFAIGGSGQTVTTNFQSGTLSNLGQVNNGADLVKTTSGTLALTGTSTYTGATAVQAGVVRFNSLAASTGAQALGSGSVVNLGVAATSTGELDYFAATSGTFDKNVFALGNGRNRIRNSGGGTLTLSGTLTKNGTILELAGGTSGGTFAVTGRITGASQNSDLYVNNATVTLSNTNNDYNGPTYVYGGGTLTLGASNVIPNGSVLLLGGTGSDTGTGTLSLGTNSEGIGGLAFGSGGGTLKLVASATGSTAQLTAATGTMTLTGGTLDLTGSGTTAGSYRLFSAQSIAGSFTSITGSNAAYQILTTSTSYDYQQRAVLGAVTVTSPTVSIITGGSAAFTYTVGNSALSGGASLGFSTGSLSNLAGSSSGTTASASTSGAISGLFFTGTSAGANQQGTFTINAPTAYGATTATGTVSVNVLAHSNAALSLTSGGGQTIITGGSFANVGFNLTNAGSNRAAVQVNSLTNLTGSTGSAVVLSDGTASYSTSILDATTIGTGTLAVSLLAGDQQSLSGASALQTLNASTTYTVLDHALPGFQASGITNPYAQDVLNINFGSVDEAAGMQFFTYNLLNLASQTYGAGLTAGLDFTGVTPDGGGFASGLSTFNNLMGGGTSSLFTFTFNPTGQGSFSKTFTLRFADNQNLSGAASRRDLTINAQVIVVPEPGTLALSGIGAAAAAWMLRRRRPPRTGYSGACGKGFVPQPTRAIRQEGRDATADGDSLGRSVQRNALQRSRRGTFA